MQWLCSAQHRNTHNAKAYRDILNHLFGKVQSNQNKAEQFCNWLGQKLHDVSPDKCRGCTSFEHLGMLLLRSPLYTLVLI